MNFIFQESHDYQRKSSCYILIHLIVTAFSKSFIGILSWIYLLCYESSQASRHHGKQRNPNGSIQHTKDPSLYGQRSDVAVSYQYKNLPTPFKTKCASPDKSFNKHLNYSYSINACVRQCMHEYIIKTCHCQALHNITRGEELCSLNDAVQCVFPIIFGDHADKLAKCINECPEPCRYKKYQTKLSYASAVSNSFSRAISSRAIAEQSSGSFRDFLDKTEEERQEFIRNNVVSLDVFFEELGYDVIEQKPAFDDWALLGAVGGTLGLFLGTSVLTVLEFLDFFVMCLIRLSRRNKSAPKEEELGEINHSVSLNLENRPSF